jgi:hypothetical protein
VAVLTGAGILNRETAFFVIPVWLWWNRPWGLRVLGRAFCVFAPAAVVYGALHHTSLVVGRPPVHLNYLSPASIAGMWHSNLRWLGTPFWPLGLGACMLLAYGPAWLLAAVGTARSR